MTLKETFEKAEIHNAWESSFRSNPLEQKLNDAIMDRLLADLSPPPNALFLDAGCGVGDHSLRIARHGYRCVGVDISEYVLQIARRSSIARALEPKTEFLCQALENLAFRDGSFDVVHCRGVLMHIPEWEKALSELCRVLKPGGKIAIFESNLKGVEMLIVRFIRALTTRQSRVVETPAGPEFWSEEDGAPFLVRFADVRYLTDRLRLLNLWDIRRFATSFWDINRFPPGAVRSAVISFNRLYFHLHLPPHLAVGNVFIGTKQA